MEEAPEQTKIREETFENISQAAARVAEATRYDADITLARDYLIKARTAFENRNYNAALDFSRKCYEFADNTLIRFTSAKAILSITEKLLLADTYKIDATPVKDIIDDAAKLHKEGNYKQASARIKEANDCLEKIFDNYILTIPNDLKNRVEIIDEIKSKKLETRPDVLEDLAMCSKDEV